MVKHLKSTFWVRVLGCTKQSVLVDLSRKWVVWKFVALFEGSLGRLESQAAALKLGPKPQSAHRAGLVGTPVMVECWELQLASLAPLVWTLHAYISPYSSSLLVVASPVPEGSPVISILLGRFWLGCLGHVSLSQLQRKLGKQVFGIFTVTMGCEQCLIRSVSSPSIATGLRCRWTKRTTNVW